MSNEQFLNDLKKQYTKLVAWFVGCSMAGIASLFGAAFVLGGKNEQFEKTKSTIEKHTTSIQAHDIEIAVLNQVTGISKNK